VLIALLFFTQDVDLDALGHPDPEARILAAAELRKSASLPLLLRGRAHADPEIRARSSDILRTLSPLAWLPHRTSPEALDVLRRQLVSPAPPDGAEQSRDFMNAHLGSGPVRDLLREASSYGQAVILVGALRAESRMEGDLDFTVSDGVIWLGYRRDLTAPRDLLSWLLEHLADPAALTILAQLVPPASTAALLDDPRPEAMDLLLRVHAFQKAEGELDPRFSPRLAARLRAADAAVAGPAALALRARPRDLAAVLHEGARSPNRWWRYLSAAIVASTPGTEADPVAYAALLRDPEAAIRAEAVAAMLRRVPPESWDRAALLEAVEGLPDLRHLLRETRDLRLQAAAVDALPRTPEASLAVLEDCDDPAILDAAGVALRGHPLLTRSTSVLRRLIETSDDPRPRAILKAIFDEWSTDAGERAAYALGGLPAGEILGFLEDRLACDVESSRHRALFALRRLGSRSERDSCLTANLRALCGSRAEAEPDSYLRGQLQELADGADFVARVPHRMRRLRGRAFSCGGVRLPQGGWRSLPPFPVTLPDWN
jgi:hypothetical protein